MRSVPAVTLCKSATTSHARWITRGMSMRLMTGHRTSLVRVSVTRFNYDRRRGGDFRAGYDDLPDHERMRRADVGVRARPVESNAPRLVPQKHPSVPPAGVGAGGVVWLAPCVGECHLRSRCNGNASGAEGIVGHLDRIGLHDRYLALEQAGEVEAHSCRRWIGSSELRDVMLGITLEREYPDHIAVRGRCLCGEAANCNRNVLFTVDLIGDRGSVSPGPGLPLPQQLTGLGIVGLKVAVGLAVE